jgi:hypothetical protein
VAADPASSGSRFTDEVLTVNMHTRETHGGNEKTIDFTASNTLTHHGERHA